MRFFPQWSETIPSALTPAEALSALRRVRIDLAGHTYRVEETGANACILLPIHDGTLWKNAFVPMLHAEIRPAETGCEISVSGQLMDTARGMIVFLLCALAVFLTAVLILSEREGGLLTVIFPLLLFGIFMWAMPQIGFRLTTERVLAQLRRTLTP